MSEIQQKTKKPIHKKWWVWVLLAALIVILITGLTAGGKMNGEKTRTVDTASTSSMTTNPAQSGPAIFGSYNIGELVKAEKLEFTALSFKDTKSDNPLLQPKDGTKYIAVEVQITNNGDEKEMVSSMMSFHLENSDGQRQMHIYTPPTDKTFEGQLSKGDTTKGTLTYEVPKNSTGLKFFYNPNSLLGKSIVVKLN